MLEPRRVTEHQAINFDEDKLLIVTVWEPSVKKEELKKQNIFSKSHEVLYFDKHLNGYQFKNA